MELQLTVDEWGHEKHILEEKSHVFLFSTLLKTLCGIGHPQKEA